MTKYCMHCDPQPDAAAQAPQATAPSPTQELLAKLTTQEMSIYLHLLQGMKRRHIALRMAISPKTYDAHRANMLRKAGSALAQLARPTCAPWPTRSATP